MLTSSMPSGRGFGPAKTLIGTTQLRYGGVEHARYAAGVVALPPLRRIENTAFVKNILPLSESAQRARRVSPCAILGCLDQDRRGHYSLPSSPIFSEDRRDFHLPNAYNGWGIGVPSLLAGPLGPG